MQSQTSMIGFKCLLKCADLLQACVIFYLLRYADCMGIFYALIMLPYTVVLGAMMTYDDGKELTRP